MSYLKIQTSTTDAKTKKPVTLENLAKANAKRWSAIEGDLLQVWQAQIAAANQTFAGLDEVWEKNREVLKKQFKGERPKSEFAKFYSGYNGSVSNLNHFITIARGKKDAEGNYTGKLFTATDVKKFRDAINAANKANKVVKYSRLINLSKWYHDGATIDALTKEGAKKSPVGTKEAKEDKTHGASRIKVSVNGKGSITETNEGELKKSLSKDSSALQLCADAFAVLFKVMEREPRDAFESFKAQVSAKCGPILAEVAE